MQLTDDWRTAGIPCPIIPESVHRSSRALQITSGNAQPYNLENLKAEEVKTESGSPHLPLDLQSQSYPPPPTLRSNAPRTITATQRLEQRRLHRAQVAHREPAGSALARPAFLKSKKYLNYRTRQRTDTGADGKPIWPDELEDVFQDALIAIPAMGRGKLSQGGKACGRNELISAYIKRWTGEHRDRKQVSSHIQVLSNLLKGNPECIFPFSYPRQNLTVVGTALTRKPANHNDSAHVNFYHDSIGDLVAARKFEAQNGHAFSIHGIPPYTGALPTPIGVLPSNGSAIKPAIMMSLDFVMWVNGPEHQEDRIEDALHVYTRLQSNFRFPEKPLEDILDWRISHPYLTELIDNPIEPLNCEIVFLEASLHLMNDFPPPRSKLGIHLELDFLRGSCAGEVPGLISWTCNTIFYENGEEVHRRQDAELQVSPSTQHGSLGMVVRPAFDAGRWAKLFTHMTELRRRSEDTGDLDPQVADEQSRQRLRHLTAVQEIRAIPLPWNEDHRGRDQGPQHYRRMVESTRVAIFLWKFRQTRPNEVGTTFWQKLVPPPRNRMETNSPLPTVDLGLPPMMIDSVVSGSHQDMQSHQEGEDGHQIVPIYEGSGWDDAALNDQHGFNFFDPTGAEGDPTVIPEMSFNDHLDLGDPSGSNQHDTTHFQAGHIVIHQDQYGESQETHLHPYHTNQNHHDGHGSFHEHDLHSSNLAAAIFNHHLPHDTNSGDFSWDPAAFEAATDRIPIDESLGVEDMGNVHLEPRRKSVVEELFPEETGADDHDAFQGSRGWREKEY